MTKVIMAPPPLPATLNNGKLSSEGEIGPHCPRADVITIHRRGKIQQATDFSLIEEKVGRNLFTYPPRNERLLLHRPPQKDPK